MKTVTQWRSVWALVGMLLTLGLAACGPATAPTNRAPEGGASAVGAVAGTGAARSVLKYEDEMVDLSTYPEPAVNLAGGIPPEDLTATPKMGGVLNISEGTPTAPHFSCCGGTFSYRVVWSGLLRWGLQCSCPQPDLAESWTVAPDGLSYDFKLRKGVKWHNSPPVNGREVTAEDIKWSLDRVSGLMETKGKAVVFAQRYENVKEFQIIDPSTLRVVMKRQDVQLLAEIMHDYMVIAPKEAAVDGDFAAPKSLIGSGPFMVEYGETAGSFKLKKHEGYWEKDKAGRQLPYLDGMFIALLADNAAKIAAFKSKQIDMTPIQYSSGRAILGDPNVRYNYKRGLVNGTIGVVMNVTTPPFNDLKVRRAVNLALDREEWEQIVYGGADAGYAVSFFGGWDPWHWSEAKMWARPGYAKGEAKLKEIEEAKKLLADAGYGNGANVIFSSGVGDAVAEVVTSQMKNVGLNLKINSQGSNKFASATQESGRQIMYTYQGGGHVPDFAITQSWLCGGVQNVGLYCNPELDKLYYESRKTRETDKRMAIMEKMQLMLWEDMPMAPGLRHNIIHAGYKHVRGYRNSWYDLNYVQGFQYANVWLDK